MRLTLSCVALLLATFAVCQAQIPRESSASRITLDNEIDTDLNSDDSDEKQGDGKPSSPSGISRIISSVIQLPMTVFRAFNTFISSAPFSRLRDEMRNLNISYPKNN